MTRYIDIEKVELNGLAVFDENLDILVSLSDVRKALQMTPTADVVPKSVIAEIFEEIENFIPRFRVGYFSYMSLEKGIAELKKKYAEVKE